MLTTLRGRFSKYYLRRQVRCTEARLQGPRVHLMPNMTSIDWYNQIGGFFPSPRSPCESTVAVTMMPSAARRQNFLCVVIFGEQTKMARTSKLAAFKVGQSALTQNNYIGLSPARLFPACRSLKRAQNSLKSAKTPDLLAFAFVHVRNQSCRLTQHMGSSPINKTRLIGALTVDWVI